MNGIFSKYPKIDYPFEIGDQTITKTMVDITANVRLTKETIDNLINYDYDVTSDDDTPEIISYNKYGTAFNHHLVIIANDKYDWRESTPLSPYELEQYVHEKYANPYGIHHYEDPQGNEIDNIYSDSGDNDFAYPKNVIPVTNYEYETRINEARRPVKIIKPQYSEIVNNLITGNLSNE